MTIAHTAELELMRTRSMVDSIKSAGITLPKPLAAAVKADEATSAWLRSVTDIERDLDGAVRAALDDGLDPLADEDVRRAAVAHVLLASGSARRINSGQSDRLREGLVASFDTIAAGVAKVHDQHVAILQKAHETLGDIDLNDPAAVVALDGPNVLEEYRKAKAAVKEVQGMRKLYRDLVRFTGRGSGMSPVAATLLIEDVDSAAVARGHAQSQPDAWTAICKGARLRLASPEEAQAKAAALEAAEELPAGTQRARRAGVVL